MRVTLTVDPHAVVAVLGKAGNLELAEQFARDTFAFSEGDLVTHSDSVDTDGHVHPYSVGTIEALHVNPQGNVYYDAEFPGAMGVGREMLEVPHGDLRPVTKLHGSYWHRPTMMERA